MRPRLALVASSSITVRYLMRGQLEFLLEHGYEVHVISSHDPELANTLDDRGIHYHGIPIARPIRPLDDIRASWHLLTVLRRIKPHIVNAGTPKAALLALAVAFAQRVPARIYLLRGLRLETARGLPRWGLWLIERLTSSLATCIIAVSPSLRDRYLALRLAHPNKVRVLANGSSNGIDFERFSQPPTDPERRKLRRELRLSDGPVIGFVGRLNPDKGLDDLWVAFSSILQSIPSAILLIVGGPDGGTAHGDTLRALFQSPAVRITGFTDRPETYYHLMTILLFPSYREGLPNAPLEAAAAGVPTVAYDVTGTKDAVVHEETGILCQRGDTAALSHSVIRLIADPTLRARLANAAAQNVQRRFSPSQVWGAYDSLYREFLTPSTPSHS